ncbi:gamma-glutamylcyclotransferase [Paenibacillus sp. MBLB4367]|uniref:gamma-glutamylcyclotransferase family protein n=1 Tax=Paenibacillus sp. MBLB4367 TaxID=3384767 RepID=UPI0039080A73
MNRVFVYGTLLSGQSNNHIAAPYTTASTPGTLRGRLYDIGDYPALVLSEDGLDVAGEWITVSDEGLRAMDDLEEYYGPGQANVYERVWIQDAYESWEGWVYVWLKAEGYPEIAPASWRLYRMGQAPL